MMNGYDSMCNIYFLLDIVELFLHENMLYFNFI